MRIALAVAVACIFMLASPASGLQSSMYMSIPNESIKCFDITLPDDAGAILKGEAEYRLQMDPLPYDTWSDLSDQIIRTDENNTVVIPVCFRSYGRETGTCGKPFYLSISSDKTPTRTVMGGVCVSTYPDADSGPGLNEGESASKGLNDNNDVIAMSFREPLQYAQPGGQATFTLQLQSYASTIVDISVESDAVVSPVRSSLATSKADPKKTLALTVTAPDETGDYAIDVYGRIRKCTGIHCTKQASAALSVQDTLPEEAGFMVSVFPPNLNLKELEPVLYEVTIFNRGPPGSFSVTAEFPDGLETNFQPETLDVGSGEDKSVLLTVTPKKVSTLYDMRFIITKDGVKKRINVTLSTNELLTDALREANEIKALGDASIEREVDESLDDFIDRYRSSEYGDDLEDYGNLKASLANARDKATQEPIEPTTPGPGAQPSGGLDLTLIIIIVVIAAGAAIGAFFFLRKRGGGKEAEIPELERF